MMEAIIAHPAQQSYQCHKLCQKPKQQPNFPLSLLAPSIDFAYSDLGYAPAFRFCFRPTSQLFDLPPPHCRFPFSSPFTPHPRFFLIFLDFSFFQTLRGTKDPRDIPLHACTQSQVQTTPTTPLFPHLIHLILNLIFPLRILTHVFPPPSSHLKRRLPHNLLT
ncbi:hypothetical protein L873DRAFT_1238944 [Choiromyces venosus 120613-1]|uniref:Uncharacterized protein n=1 Tax=Choiromyces venosus 120613-1 TaxID=1336337 RepID=A0A3N4JI60_9PEZI|nr:hypothetical protein L873DRAFT_1238944 [Choiromyces venosus 120613-1]